MTEPISKIPASPTHRKNSVKAVVDERGILLGAEVEIDGVGISLPAEQFSSVDSAMAHPKIIWVDGHTWREIFVDTVKMTSYVRSVRDNNPLIELVQDVITEVDTVVEHIVASVKAASGLSSKPQEKPKKEASSSPEENIVKGGLNVETPQVKEAALAAPQADAVQAVPGLQAPVANNLFIGGGILFSETDKTPPASAPSLTAENNVPRCAPDSPECHWTNGPSEIQENRVEKHDANPSPLISGAVYIWMGAQTEDREEKRAERLNRRNSPLSLGARMAGTNESGPSNVGTITEAKDSGPTDQRTHPFAAREEKTPHPTQKVSQPDKPAILGGEETNNPIGAPIAPPPPATLTVLAASKWPAIKDSALIERPSRSQGSHREGRDHQGQQDRQQNPQDEYPAGSEE